MKLMFPLLVLAASGCGTEPDSRPPTFEVVTLQVLGPSCGQVQCHSTATYARGYAFDTLAAARASMKSSGSRAQILRQMQRGSMPPDQPLADEDLALYEAWVTAGAPGL